MNEDASNVKLFAVVRIWAESEDPAREVMERALDAADVMTAINDREAKVLITEASLYIDDEGGPLLIEVDGQEVD